MQVDVVYHDKRLTPLEWTEKGDAVDLRASSVKYVDPWTGSTRTKDLYTEGHFKYHPGQEFLIKLGFSAKLPTGYSALVVPRSSTYKNFQLIQTNNVGVIDNSYKGDNDEWCFPVKALGYGTISHNDRLCQFLLQKIRPMKFNVVQSLGNESRGGFGSTGVK